YYDENDNEVKVKQKRGGCLKWVLYGFIVIVVLGACGAILDDGEEVTEEQKTEESKEEKVSDENEESEPAENETESEEDEKPAKEEKGDEESETKTVEDIANLRLNNVTSTDEYDGELTIIYEPDLSNNEKRMITIIKNQINQFKKDKKRKDEKNLNDYSAIVVMANTDSAVLYSIRITNDQFNELPENDIDEQIRHQYNMEDYVDQVSMLPQYRKVDLGGVIITPLIMQGV